MAIFTLTIDFYKKIGLYWPSAASVALHKRLGRNVGASVRKNTHPAGACSVASVCLAFAGHGRRCQHQAGHRNAKGQQLQAAE